MYSASHLRRPNLRYAASEAWNRARHLNSYENRTEVVPPSESQSHGTACDFLWRIENDQTHSYTKHLCCPYTGIYCYRKVSSGVIRCFMRRTARNRSVCICYVGNTCASATCCEDYKSFLNWMWNENKFHVGADSLGPHLRHDVWRTP
jgi:hypothetical protein